MPNLTLSSPVVANHDFSSLRYTIYYINVNSRMSLELILSRKFLGIFSKL